jgi:hypothetical protein
LKLKLIRTKTKDNLIASVVDFTSIVFAYKLGLAQLGIAAGVGYGVFDAWIVIWQRERIASVVCAISDRLRSPHSFRRKSTALPWDAE